eukprot:5992571-Pyramimonas_sp.AAC.1
MGVWLRKGVPLVPSLAGSTIKGHLVTVALAEPTNFGCQYCCRLSFVAVSYTHLTLPTILLV